MQMLPRSEEEEAVERMKGRRGANDIMMEDDTRSVRHDRPAPMSDDL